MKNILNKNAISAIKPAIEILKRGLTDILLHAMGNKREYTKFMRLLWILSKMGGFGSKQAQQQLHKSLEEQQSFRALFVSVLLLMSVWSLSSLALLYISNCRMPKRNYTVYNMMANVVNSESLYFDYEFSRKNDELLSF
uniref:Uncharacterized protein n=1 Tax=Glossina brevipalpis TaxID=37001 RepID=A0A1A9WS03_9MUSC